MRIALMVGTTLLLGACSLTRPDEDPVQIRMNDLDTRLARLEGLLSNQSLMELAQRVERLESEARNLTGSLEVLENGTEGVRKQQRDLYADLNRRVGVLEGNGGRTLGGTFIAPVAAAENGGARENSSGEQAAYDAAFDALKNGQYDVAITRFRQFLSTWPASDFADNAQYWLGEAYYVTRDYENAAGAFSRGLEQWPQSRKAPDALLKLGFAQYELKRFPQARQTLTQVVVRYPGTEAARLAQERMKRLAAEQR